MKKLKIAMVAACPFPANRGTPSRILRMAEALSGLGHCVCVATYHFGTQTETKGIEIHRIPRIPYYYYAPGPTLTKLGILDPLLFLKLFKMVKSKRIDLVHAHHFEGAIVGYAVRKLSGVRVLYDAHTTLKSELDSYGFFNIKSLSRFLDKKVPEWSDHVIAASDTLKVFLQGIGINRSKIDVIPTGVNPEHFEGKDPNAMRKRYKIGRSQIVLYTGSLANFQGIDYLIQAMKGVFEKRKNVALILVGNSKSDKIRDICLKNGILDKVIIAGERKFDEIPLFLASADVAVIPRIECPGIPQKLTNYMAAQKAIVSFKGSAKLLINEHNGLVVENGDTVAMANSIITLLDNKDLRKKLAGNAKSTLVGTYDWNSLCQRLEKIYFRLLGLEARRG